MKNFKKEKLSRKIVTRIKRYEFISKFNCFSIFILCPLSLIFYYIVAPIHFIDLDSRILIKIICLLPWISIPLSFLSSSFKKFYIDKLKLKWFGYSSDWKLKINLKDTLILRKENSLKIVEKGKLEYKQLDINLFFVKEEVKTHNYTDYIWVVQFPKKKRFNSKAIIVNELNFQYDKEILKYPQIRFFQTKLNFIYKMYSSNPEDTMNNLTLKFTNNILELTKKLDDKINIEINNSFINFSFESKFKEIRDIEIDKIIKIIDILEIEDVI